MKILHLIFLGSLLSFSCRQEKKIAALPIEEIESKASLTPRDFNEFDWLAPERLKQKLIKDISEKKDSIDILILNFLDDYRELIEKVNNTLYDLKYYDSLNTLAYSEGEVYQVAKDFERQVNKNGFILTSSEGMIYIAESSDYIKKDIINLIDTYSKEFLIQYCNQVENICCDDAALVISEEELVNRIYNWGELLSKVQGSKYASIVDGHFYGNLSLLYEGLDNTPSFDMETKLFSTSLIDQMNKLIKKHPESKASIEFQEFLNLIASDNYKKTDKVSDYIKQRTNQTSQW
jgi:hypothetical protein